MRQLRKRSHGIDLGRASISGVIQFCTAPLDKGYLRFALLHGTIGDYIV